MSVRVGMVTREWRKGILCAGWAGGWAGLMADGVRGGNVYYWLGWSVFIQWMNSFDKGLMV